jgi:hypothetical protein
MPALIIGVARWGFQTASAASSSFYAAKFEGGQGPHSPPLLTLFPMEGPEEAASLPDGLPTNFRLIAFSPDGKSVYGQKNDPSDPSNVIIKIEFMPARQSAVQGSAGFGPIWFLTPSPQLGKIFVSGWSKRRGKGECGAFEIDPDTGSFRTLREGIYPDCGGGVGPISPDGKSILSHHGNRLNLLDLKTGAADQLGAGLEWATWSPDGRWIAAWGVGRIILIDATNTSRRISLGSSGDNDVRWSPDSKSLLLSKSQVSCWPSLFTGSLEVVNVDRSKAANQEFALQDRHYSHWLD